MAQIDIWNLEQEQEEDTLKGKHLIFSLAGELYGIEIRCVTEIIGVQPITQVPEMPDYILGVTNLRGTIIPVMDARLRFRKPPKEYDDKTCIVVLDTGELSLGLIVDSVAEVLYLRDEDIAPPPDLHKGGRKYIKGIGTAGGTVRLLLDCAELLSEDEVELVEDAMPGEEEASAPAKATAKSPAKASAPKRGKKS